MTLIHTPPENTMKDGLKINKGDIVTIKPEAFGEVWDNDTRTYQPGHEYKANYKYTAADTERWYERKRKATEEAIAKGEDTFNINFDCAGESRLPPKGGYTPLYRGIGYRVLRARCRVSFSYHNPTGGWAKLLDMATGREVYVKRTKLQKEG